MLEDLGSFEYNEILKFKKGIVKLLLFLGKFVQILCDSILYFDEFIIICEMSEYFFNRILVVYKIEYECVLY